MFLLATLNIKLSRRRLVTLAEVNTWELMGRLVFNIIYDHNKHLFFIFEYINSNTITTSILY